MRKLIMKGFSPKLAAGYLLAVVLLAGFLDPLRPKAVADNHPPQPSINITAHWPGTTSSSGAAVSESQEDAAQNLIIPLNDDHEEKRKATGNTWMPDHNNASIGGTDNDIVKLECTLTAPSGTGSVTLTVPNSMNVFDSSGGGVGNSITMSVSSPSGPLASITGTGAVLFVEGKATAQNIEIKLEYTDNGSTTSDSVRAHIMDVDFEEINDGVGFGYDDYSYETGTEQFHWKSLEHLFTDKVMANTVPTTLYSFAQFRSTNTNMRVLQTPASAAAHTLTFYGDWTGDADGQAHHNQKAFFDDLKTRVYSKKEKRVAIRVVHSVNYQSTAGANVSISAVKDLLRAVYKQAVFRWDVTSISAITVNFNADADNTTIDTMGSWPSQEVQNLDAAARPSGTYDYYIYLIDKGNYPGGAGWMGIGSDYGVVHADTSSDPSRTIAHELGHGAFSFYHVNEDPREGNDWNENDSANIMWAYLSTTNWRLRKSQWDIINP